MRLASADVAAPFVSDVLARDAVAWVRTSSESMAPLLRPGDRLRLVRVDRETIRPGDLIAYRRATSLVVHRVIARAADGVVTKGDALPHADTRVPWPAVVARVGGIVDAGGRTHELDAARWRAINRLAAALSRLGAVVGPPDRSWRRPAWAALRGPMHLGAWVLR
jgi:signal peptidase I